MNWGKYQVWFEGMDGVAYCHVQAYATYEHAAEIAMRISATFPVHAWIVAL